MNPISITGIENPGFAIQKPDSAKAAEGFGSALQDAISKVDAVQVEADQQSASLAAGDGNLHETMLALEKADVAMRVAMKVRNKILDAYNEVMRMSV